MAAVARQVLAVGSHPISQEHPAQTRLETRRPVPAGYYTTIRAIRNPRVKRALNQGACHDYGGTPGVVRRPWPWRSGRSPYRPKPHCGMRWPERRGCPISLRQPLPTCGRLLVLRYLGQSCSGTVHNPPNGAIYLRLRRRKREHALAIDDLAQVMRNATQQELYLRTLKPAQQQPT